MILLVKGEPLGGKELITEPICPSLFLNPFPPRAAKSEHFVILLCLTPGWERVKNNLFMYLLIDFVSQLIINDTCFLTLLII